MTGALPRSTDQTLASGVVRLSDQDGQPCGTGALVAPDLVLTCAHVVSDCLGTPRRDLVESGAGVMVDFPLAGQYARDLGPRVAQVERWIPVRADRTGDVALLRMREPVPGTHPLPLADPEDMWEHRARTVGFTGGEPTALWFRGLLSGTTEEGWVQLSRADGQTAYAREGFSGGPVWDDELGAVIGLVVAAQAEREAQQVFVLRTGTLLRELPELETVLLPAAPFRGLAPLGEEDADVFFGRNEDVERVVTVLHGGHSAVTVYGPSGCGKSSLALAGVVPRMRQEGHEVLVLDAGRTSSTAAALATELSALVASGRYGAQRAEQADPDRIRRWLDELGPADAFHRVTGRQGTNVLVVLDQAEALLNLSEPEIARAVALLFPEQRTDGLRVLLTLRADFMDTALSHPELGPALRRGTTLPLTPMTRDQLRTVITEPVRRVSGVEYDPGLEQRILDDAGHDPGALPLLGFVLAKLWENRSGGRLRAEAYEELGRVPGALRRHAAQAWQACVRPGEEAEARLLLTGLVRVLPGGEAPLRRVLTREEVGERRWELVRAFARADWRLLVLHGGDGHPQSAELSHEALITAWPELAEETRASADFLAGRAEVQHDLERWRSAGRPADLLPGPLQLTALESSLRQRETDLTGEEREFLAQARRRRRRHRNARRGSVVAGALALALIAGLTVFLVQESNVRSQREAEGLSRSLAIQSDQMVEGNPVQAALVALAAYEAAPTQEARSALMRRYLGFQEAEWSLSGAEGQIREADMSVDGMVTLVRTEGGRATLFVRTAEGGVRQEQLGLTQNVLVPVVSRDGRRIAYVHDVDGTVVWHEVTPGGQRLLGPPNRLEGALTERSLGVTFFGDMHIMDFSPEGRQLVGAPAAESDQPVQVWDLKTGRPRPLPEDTPRLTEVWFGPDEDTLVAVTADPGSMGGSVVTIDIATGTVRELAEGAETQYAGIAGDGSVVVVCREEEGIDDSDGYAPGEARYQAVRVADGQVLREHSGEEYSSCVDVTVSERGDRFAVPDTDEEWVLVDTSGQEEAARFLGPLRFMDKGLLYMRRVPLLLLGTASAPTLVTWEANRVTGWQMAADRGETAHGNPQLIGDGSTMVVRLGRNGDNLSVLETEGERRTLASVDRDIPVPAEIEQELQVNRTETLVADISDQNRITVYELPSLRRVSEFTTVPPPSDAVENADWLSIRFHDADQLVTVSGGNLERWDAHTGRRLSFLDLDGLQLTEEEETYYTVTSHPEPGHVSVIADGKQLLHAVDLANGERKEELDVRLDDVEAAIFLEDPHYMAVLTTGRMVELWSVPPDQDPARVLGSLGPLKSNRWSLTTPGGSVFFLASDSTAQFLWADDPTRRETYQFDEPQGFSAVTQDGRALLRTPLKGGWMSLLRLDPELWKRHLCVVTGRELTADEAGALPSDVPAEVCSGDS
ncbi:nSTAND1 domain-containing NTPase [Nocardiopsis ganjiahuensis]|uniref:nSTAND1 domain-containing NTPase n=1 Tax=Nocardiopsis ganjiahuensis TaxID=239984 RepID=UPI000360809D|nr:trypsin-like peptidase domain-containing protein [Nocardiopsis ganjiahuensis]